MDEKILQRDWDISENLKTNNLTGSFFFYLELCLREKGRWISYLGIMTKKKVPLSLDVYSSNRFRVLRQDTQELSY